jgi:uncharacterized coiled-coil protein SlyX
MSEEMQLALEHTLKTMRKLKEAADTITTLRADHQKLNERNAEYIGTIDRLRRRVAETDVEIERLRDVMKTAIRQFEDGNRLSCHRTLCDEVYGRQK